MTKQMIDDYFDPTISKAEFYHRHEVTTEEITDGVDHLISTVLYALGVMDGGVSSEEFRSMAIETYIMAMPTKGGVM